MAVSIGWVLLRVQYVNTRPGGGPITVSDTRSRFLIGYPKHARSRLGIQGCSITSTVYTVLSCSDAPVFISMRTRSYQLPCASCNAAACNHFATIQRDVSVHSIVSELKPRAPTAHPPVYKSGRTASAARGVRRCKLSGRMILSCAEYN